MANNSIAAYRAQIGLFNINTSKNDSKIKNWVYILRSFSDIIFVLTFINFAFLIVSKYCALTMSKICLDGLFSTIFGENSRKFTSISHHFLEILIKKLLKNCVVFLVKFMQISSFVLNFNSSVFTKCSLRTLASIFSSPLLNFFFSIKIAKFLIMCGDVESNPGFTFMQWNCNSLPAHNFTRVTLIEAYNTLHNFDLIALSETALRPDHQNKPLEIKGYSIIRNDLPTGDTHGGVMIYQ